MVIAVARTTVCGRERSGGPEIEQSIGNIRRAPRRHVIRKVKRRPSLFDDGRHYTRPPVGDLQLFTSVIT